MYLLHIMCFVFNWKEVKNPKWWTLFLLILCLSDSNARAEDYHTLNLYSAVINITYTTKTGEYVSTKTEMGRYGQNSRLDNESGMVVHVRTKDNKTHGCSPPENVPAKEKWIALISRGECKFTKKILNAAVIRNASAVIIYNNMEDETLLTMDHKG